MRHLIMFNKQKGFTLVEIAVVLLIVSILLGYTVAMFPAQQNLKRYSAVDKELNEIREVLIAYAQVNGRLPCPDTSAGGSTIDGISDSIGTPITGCDAYFGFLPKVTLGIDGESVASNGLGDPWSQPYRYHVSNIDTSDGNPDLVSRNGVQIEGLSNVIPNLVICNQNPSVGNDLGCASAAQQVAGNVAAVIISLGRDKGGIGSAIQNENVDGFHDGTLDTVYVSTTQSDASGSEFDDAIRWIPTSLLFSKMIEAGQLP